MSDPPYYTACPSPFLADFVAYHGRPYHPDEEYHREPYAVDVSVGKTDKLYRAHGYHTKVPHLAIVPSILHYTKPGDIVLDGFCGSGMTAVAAQWCGTAPESYRKKLEQRWKQEGRDAPEWGARRVILGDLSPAATFIAANYNIPFDVDEFAEAARQLSGDVEDEVGWMYETMHTDGRTEGRINYTVWSEVFSCPECAGEVVFTREALDMRTKRVRPSFPCPGCGILLKKRMMGRFRFFRNDFAFSGSGGLGWLLVFGNLTVDLHTVLDLHGYDPAPDDPPRSSDPNRAPVVARARRSADRPAGGGETWAVEIKRSTVPSVSRGFRNACDDVKPTRRLVVHGGDESYPLRGVEAMSLGDMCGEAGP